MNKIRTIIDNKRGATVVLLTVLIMSSILTVALSLGSVVINGLKVSKDQANATQAYFAAEAGAEKFLWEVRKNNFDPTTSSPACSSDEYISADFLGCENTIDPLARSTSTNGSSFYIFYEYPVVNATTTLTNFGEYKGTRRAVKLKY